MAPIVRMIPACLAFLMLVAGQLQAGHLYHQAIYGPENAGYDAYLPLPQFDPALGNLDSVYMYMRTTVQGDLKLENEANAPHDVNVRVASSSTVEVLNGLYSQRIYVDEQVIQTLAAYDGTTDWLGDSAWTVYYDRTQGQDWWFLAGENDLNPFIGTGSVSFHVFSDNTSELTGLEGVNWLARNEGDAFMTLDYYYTPVPEPGGILTLMAGLTALSGARLAARGRRRR